MPVGGKNLIDIMNDHDLKQLVHIPTQEMNTLDLILTSLPGQFPDIIILWTNLVIMMSLLEL